MKKTPEEIKNKIAKSRGYNDWYDLIDGYYPSSLSEVDDCENQAMQEYADQEAKDFTEWIKNNSEIIIIPEHQGIDTWFDDENFKPMTSEQLYTKYKQTK